jgi:hypothetical protein
MTMIVESTDGDKCREKTNDKLEPVFPKLAVGCANPVGDVDLA